MAPSAVTRKILQQHGGRIELANALEADRPATSVSVEGTTFIMTLPSDRTPAMDLGDTRLPKPVPAPDHDEDFA